MAPAFPYHNRNPMPPPINFHTFPTPEHPTIPPSPYLASIELLYGTTNSAPMGPAFRFHNHNPMPPPIYFPTFQPPNHPTVLPPPPYQLQPTPHSLTSASSSATERQQTAQLKHELNQLHSTRRSVIEDLKTITATRKALVEAFEEIEKEMKRSWRPDVYLADIQSLRHEMVQMEQQNKECHRRWDELGEAIERKHVEIAFGVEE